MLLRYNVLDLLGNQVVKTKNLFKMNEDIRLEMRLEGMSDILRGLNITVSNDDLKFIVEEYDAGVRMEDEIDSYQHEGGIDYKTEYEKQQRVISDLRSELLSTERERVIYHKNVCKRYKQDVEIMDGQIVSTNQCR